jgi:hypothetical protein
MDDGDYYLGNSIVVGSGDAERTTLGAETETGLQTLHNYPDWQKMIVCYSRIYHRQYQCIVSRGETWCRPGYVIREPLLCRESHTAKT